MNADDILSALSRVIDPELGMNILDLGMVRDVVTRDSRVASVDLALTTVACPLWELFEEQIRLALGSDVVVRFVSDPPWTPEMMTEEARKELMRRGMLSPSATLIFTAHNDGSGG